MEHINIKARIRRNMLNKLSGKYYRDESSDIIQHLNSKGKNAIVGIQQDKGIYTIIGIDKVYYLTPFKTEGEISIENFLTILREVTLALGKNTQYEFIKINKNDSIWVMNSQTMNALWNTMLLFFPMQQTP
jgi:hypothetical protein